MEKKVFRVGALCLAAAGSLTKEEYDARYTLEDMVVTVLIGGVCYYASCTELDALVNTYKVL